ECSLHLPISGKTHQRAHILPGPQVGTRLALPSEARLSPQPSRTREVSHMGDAATRQRFSGFMFLMVRKNARPGESPKPLVMRATRLVLILLLTVLSTAVAGSAEPFFIPIDLGTLGGNASANAVNDSGQVVGWSNPTGDFRFHAFSWTPAGGMVDLGTLGGSDSFALAVNAGGQVVGGVSGTRNRAFSWTPAEGMIDLGTLGGT